MPDLDSPDTIVSSDFDEAERPAESSPGSKTDDAQRGPHFDPSLERKFDDFFTRKDAQAEEERDEAPETPPETEKPAEEPEKPAEKPTEPKTETPDDDSDLKQYTPKATAAPRVRRDISALKNLVKTERQARRELTTKFAELESRYKALETSKVDPELVERYNQLQQTVALIDAENDPYFQAQFVQAIDTAKNQLFDDLIELGNNTDIVKAWAEHNRNYSLDVLSKGWWNQQVLANIADDVSRSQVSNRIAQLLELDKARKDHLKAYGKDPERMRAEKQARDDYYRENWAKEIQDEGLKILKELGPEYQWINDIDSITDQKKKSEALEQNKRMTGYEVAWKTALQEMNDGPRNQARIAARLLLGEQAKEKLEKAEKRTAELEKELKSVSDRLERVTGVRRLPGHGADEGSGKGPPQKFSPIRIGMKTDDAIESWFNAKDAAKR
jgi:hypothetical protein